MSLPGIDTMPQIVTRHTWLRLLQHQKKGADDPSRLRLSGNRYWWSVGCVEGGAVSVVAVAVE